MSRLLLAASMCWMRNTAELRRKELPQRAGLAVTVTCDEFHYR